MEQKKEYLTSFGRTQTRPLSGNQKRLIEEVLPKISISKFPELGYEQIWLEIGFGGGENLAQLAKDNPDIGFIGCEPYINGAVKLLTHIDENKLENIRLYNGDARDLISEFPDECMDRIYIMHPDPWPKKRHHKRRIINEKMLDMLHRILKKEAILRLATDDADYAKWIIRHFLDDGRFKWLAESKADWEDEPSDHVQTKYQKKALKEGRKPVFMEFTKT